MAIKRTLCQIFKNFTDSMITEVEFFYDNSFHFGFLSLDSETEINIFFYLNGVKKTQFQYISKMRWRSQPGFGTNILISQAGYFYLSPLSSLWKGSVVGADWFLFISNHELIRSQSWPIEQTEIIFLLELYNTL